MITEIRSEKLVVFSDLHLGNPFSRARASTIAFIQWASSQGYDLCINGDGFEVAQASVSKLAGEIPPVLQAIRLATQRGRKVYYIVGNHDIVFENFLYDWGGFTVSPFLNLQSGEKRIRIEHGHLYDPFFVKYPRLYEWSTFAAGLILQFFPQAYRIWIGFEKWKAKLRLSKKKSITGEPPSFLQAAQELQARGFDAVIFGHTHHAGRVNSADGTYLNSGAFMLNGNFIEINKGVLELKQFKERYE